jgi:hypothetical protein
MACVLNILPISKFAQTIKIKIKKDIYLGSLDSFDDVFTQPKIILCNSPKTKFGNLAKFSTLIH